MLLGTSPFVGAGQFGTRAWMYYRIFRGHPERIAEIIVEAYRFLSQLGCVDSVAVGSASVERLGRLFQRP